MDTPLVAYLPQDRQRALALGEDLPERTTGVALFADISGFTPLTEALDRALGARRGAEARVQQINQVYEALAHVEDILAYLSGGGTLDGAEEPLWMLLTCYRVLQAQSDERAAGVLETAQATLQERAAKTSDEAMRRSFLENVPYHREIAAAWAEAHSGR
jgi:class 3 adenylate cyclase